MTRIAFAIVGDFGRGRKGVGVIIDAPTSVECLKVNRVAGLNRQHGREIWGVVTVERVGHGFKAMGCHKTSAGTKTSAYEDRRIYKSQYAHARIREYRHCPGNKWRCRRQRWAGRLAWGSCEPRLLSGRNIQCRINIAH